MLAGEELEKTRAKTAAEKAEKAEKALKSPRVKRTTTIAQTTQVSLSHPCSFPIRPGISVYTQHESLE